MSATPGPWYEMNGVVWAGSGVVGLPDGPTIVAEVENEADARLIAAAPDLLAALEFIAAWGMPSTVNPVKSRARAAIAKAKGKTDARLS
jgi:hypothetical protein